MGWRERIGGNVAADVPTAIIERPAPIWMARRGRPVGLTGYALHDVSIAANGITLGLYHRGKLYWLVIEPQYNGLTLTSADDTRHVSHVLPDIWDEQSIGALIPTLIQALS
jgi:hypothetical protein